MEEPKLIVIVWTRLYSCIKLYKAQMHSIREVTGITGVSQATLYRYIKAGLIGILLYLYVDIWYIGA